MKITPRFEIYENGVSATLLAISSSTVPPMYINVLDIVLQHTRVSLRVIHGELRGYIFTLSLVIDSGIPEFECYIRNVKTNPPDDYIDTEDLLGSYDSGCIE